MEEQSKDISDFIGAFRRYRRKILSIFIVIFGVTAVAAVLWPPTYRSSATILIESQEVPQDLVRSTITSFATQRIQQTQARVMSRTHLMNII
ncbi:MAG TPA: lipopolysaccharide biosynthesis protein, partial [Chromatiales bacterium]|nr:lipopolysaccharide biosynthesis protein [Chromatiales bacterium]